MQHSPLGQRRVRVAIVDDSATMRSWLKLLFKSDARLEVVGEAAGAREARDLLRDTQVDVMTLDVDMPGMSGLEFLAKLMVHRPMPVVMLSALTEKGSQEAIHAFSLGAIDCIEKPKSAHTEAYEKDVCQRVWQASLARVSAPSRRAPKTASSFAGPRRRESDHWTGGVIVIGASTGGVAALEGLLPEIDDIPMPVVIAQHMPENFLDSFSRRLNEHLNRGFRMAHDGIELTSYDCVMALGKTVSTHLVKRRDGSIECKFSPPTEGTVFRPNVDDLFHSTAKSGLTGYGVLLTGMGSDGAEGLKALRSSGFSTFAQDEASCVVFGMPKAAIALDAADHVMSPEKIGQSLRSKVLATTS